MIMATNNNVSIAKRIRDLFKLQQAVEEVPTQVAGSILPVVDVSPSHTIFSARGDAQDSATGTIFSTSATKRTFIIGCHITTAKDVVSPSTNTLIDFTSKDGSTDVLIITRYEPVTAGSFFSSISFPEPIEIEKDTAIVLRNSSATASIDSTGIIFFYEEDP